MELKLNSLSYKNIKVGDRFSYRRFVDEKLVKQFAKISGDYNPLHLDKTYAQKTPFKGRIAHGLLLSSFFSPLVGMLCPGKNALYLSQSLNFKNPVRFGQWLTVSGRVTAKSDTLKVITLATEISNKKGKVFVGGEALVKSL